MKYNALPLQRLVEQFASLPGIGYKTAQKLAFHMLGLSDDDVKAFADAVLEAHEKIRHCKVCYNFTDKEICPVCDAPARNKNLICVVESPKDIAVFERSGSYKGVYHVLQGLISPMEGIGPDQLQIKSLLSRLNGGDVEEVILATSPTVEGDATSMYLSRLIKPLGMKVSRLAYGIPVGGELEYADDMTLTKALENRNLM